ncbi:MAG: 50S ribosomal protein L10 [Myxococcota bacterium]
MLTYAQKQEQVVELQEKLERASSVIVADYRGLDVPAVNELRAKLRAAGECEYRVVKNSVLRRASEGTGVASIAEHFRGPTAVALAFGDPVVLAKTLSEFAKDNEVFELRGGWLEGEALDATAIATLATLPSLEQLRAKLVGLVQAPAQKLVMVCQAPAAQLARIAEARSKKLEESGAA